MRVEIERGQGALSVARSFAMALVVWLAVPAFAAAQSASWTVAGSTGTVDESNADQIEFGATGGGISILHEAVFLKEDVPAPAAAVIRYNVLAVDGLVSGGPHWALVGRLRDSGAAVVFVRLIRVNLGTGSSTELLTLQSNLSPVASGFRRISTGRPPCSNPGFVFDFSNNLYFVEVSLQKDGANGSPALAGAQIRPTTCRS